jgi:hypothetical protein
VSKSSLQACLAALDQMHAGMMRSLHASAKMAFTDCTVKIRDVQIGTEPQNAVDTASARTGNAFAARGLALPKV